MKGWRATAGLSRALVVGAAAVGGAVLGGEPVLLMIAAPLIVVAAMAVAARPSGTPAVSAALDHVSLHEGQGTTSRLQIVGGDDVEQVSRVAPRTTFVALHPAGGMVSRLTRHGPPDLEISPRRWGRRVLAQERVALTTPWAGYRWGPLALTGDQMRVLPSTATYASRAESPQPKGLVGAHRSTQPGAGTEFAGIRVFQPGDRLRRINWRVSARTRELHVTTTRDEQDAGILLVVDALADNGRSGGVDGAASSLDLTVRAAAAVAEHAVRQGDRVALRVVGGGERQIGYGVGWPHLRRLLGILADVQPGTPHDDDVSRLQLRVSEGTTVVMLSPVLAAAISTTAATMMRRGLPTLVIDTLPADAAPGTREDADPQLAELAWRMRRIEREQVLAALGALGCPIVAWRGPGTIDDVLHRLARRAQLPRVRVR